MTGQAPEARRAALQARHSPRACKCLARFKVPRHILFFDAAEIPLTPTRRAKKFRLAAMARERLAEGVSCERS